MSEPTLTDARTQTFGAWLDTRMDGVPGELKARLGEVIPAHTRVVPVAEAIEELPAVAAQYLNRIVAGGCTTRESALDLLALDALVTYLVEAGAAIGVETDTWALRLMSQLASVRPTQEHA
jgi:hypothetical protein